MNKYCLSFIFLPLLGWSQSFPVIKYNESQGLGHSIVYRIYEDRKGFLWLSTDNGLTRYDGKEFKNFGVKDGLRSTFIFGVTENDSALVISTFGGGLQTMERSVIDTVNRLAPSITFPINLQQHQSSLWVVDRSLDLYQVTRDSSRIFSNSTAYKIKKVSDIIMTSKGLVLLGYGVYLFDEVEQVFKPVPLKGEGLSNVAYVKSGLELPGGNLLLSVTAQIGLVLVEMEHLQTKVIKPGKFTLSHKNMLLRHDSTVLVAEDNGVLWHFSKDLKTSRKILEGIVINDLYEDKAHRIWLGTHGEGLWCLPNIDATVFSLKGFLSASISKTAYTGKVLVSSLNNPVQVLASISTETQSQVLAPIIKQSGVTYIHETDNDQKEILVGNLHSAYRLRKDKIDSLTFGRTQTSALRDKAGNYWFGMRTGLAKADADFKQYTFVQAFKNKIIRSVSLNHLSALTVGTNDGLFIKSDTSWLRLGKADGLDNEYVNMALADTTRNCTWLATNDGLLRYEGETIQMAYPGLRCSGMLLDKRQYLWVSTSKGLLYYDGQQMNVFSESHGIPQNLLNLSYDEDNDTFYILSNNSVTKFSAQTILAMADPQAPAIYIPEHTINGKVHAVFTDRINELTDSVNTLTLTISAPYLGQTDRWILFYRLNGKAWARAGNTSKLNFVELPYGEVSIELQMRDEINHISSSPLTVVYLIPTPWYRTKMGIAGLLTLILILASFLSYLLIQRIELKKQKRFLAKQRRAELEHKVLRNMLNPHFLNNALNAIQVFVTRNDQRKTLGYLAKFARLMRINLELLEKSLVPLEKELNNIELYLEFEVLRSEDKLNYALTIDPAINQSTIKVPSLVLQPFVENAIWHGILPKTTGGHVGIYIKQINRLLHISIVDNGIGLEESRKRKHLSADHQPSRGIALIRERFTLLNHQNPGHSFAIKKNEEQDPNTTGVTVEIILPVIF